VHDDLQVLELFEDSVHRRGTHFGVARLHLLGYLLGREMTGSGERTSATVRLATVTRFVAPRIAERISLTSGLVVDIEKPYVARTAYRAARPSITRWASSTIERTMAPAGTIRRDCPHGLSGGVALSSRIDAERVLVAAQVEGRVVERDRQLVREFLQQRRIGLVAIGRVVAKNRIVLH